MTGACCAEGGEAHAHASGRPQRAYSSSEPRANVGVVVADAAAHTDGIHPRDAAEIDDGDCQRLGHFLPDGLVLDFSGGLAVAAQKLLAAGDGLHAAALPTDACFAIHVDDMMADLGQPGDGAISLAQPDARAGSCRHRQIGGALPGLQDPKRGFGRGRRRRCHWPRVQLRRSHWQRHSQCCARHKLASSTTLRSPARPLSVVRRWPCPRPRADDLIRPARPVDAPAAARNPGPLGIVRRACSAGLQARQR